MTGGAGRPAVAPPDARAFFAMPGVVGVTGHRLNRLTRRHEAQLSALCTALFAEPHPGCALLTCLAEGVDTILAEAWPATRSLHALLPTGQAAWRARMGRVMDPARFDMLAARACLTTLDGDECGGGDVDFAALSRNLVARCDRLFAVWDGEPGRPGGTGYTVDLARRAARPVLHLRHLDDGFAWATAP